MKGNPRFRATLALLGAALCVGGGSAADSIPFTEEQRHEPADLRLAGVRGDASSPQDLFKALRTKPPFFQVTALRALGRIGSPETLPLLDEYIREVDEAFQENPANFPYNLPAQLRAARARVVAESAEKREANPAKPERGAQRDSPARHKVARLLSELGMDAAKLTAELDAHDARRLRPKSPKLPPPLASCTSMTCITDTRAPDAAVRPIPAVGRA